MDRTQRAKLTAAGRCCSLGFAVVPIRGVLFATVTDPYLLVAVQLFDGITAAVFTVLVPLIVADIARGTGRSISRSASLELATGIGASLSTTLAGYVSDHFGSPVAFLSLAGIGARVSPWSGR